MEVRSLSEYRAWLNGSEMRIPEVPITPREITPLDTHEPYMDSRSELALAADDLCLAAYALMDGKSEDLEGKQPRIFSKNYTTHENGLLEARSDEIAFWEITATKFGSIEPIPTPALRASYMPSSVLRTIEARIRKIEADTYSFYDGTSAGHALKVINEIEKLSQGARTFVAAGPTGLALVTEAYNETTDEWFIADFRQDTINPDDIFADSADQSSHQELYQQMMRQMVQLYGEHLPQAIDRREIYGRRVGEMAIGEEVDISNIQIEPKTLKTINETIGKRHGRIWPQWLHDGNVEGVGTDVKDNPSPEEKAAMPFLYDETETEADSDLIYEQTDDDEIVTELDAMRYLICKAALELIDMYQLDESDTFGLRIPYDDGDAQYILYHNMFRGYGERATLSKFTPERHTEYGIFNVEKYPGAIPHKGQTISAQEAPEILRVLEDMIDEAQMFEAA